MKLSKIFILIILFSNALVGQNTCGNFKDYDDSQNWIKKLKELIPEERKTKIIQRIECEQESEQNDIDFQLTIIIDRSSIFKANEIPKKRIEIFKLIPAEYYNIGQSICESVGIYPQECNLGYTYLIGFEKPILNENDGLKNIILKRKKGRIIIILESDRENEIEFKLSDFIKIDSSAETKKIKIKKGRNRIVIPVDLGLKLIELESKGNKTLILK